MQQMDTCSSSSHTDSTLASPVTTSLFSSLGGWWSSADSTTATTGKLNDVESQLDESEQQHETTRNKTNGHAREATEDEKKG